MEFSDIQTERYARHFVLREVGVAGQKKLLSSRVLVIGAGGLGSAALSYLASAGVGTIGIADFDKVSLSNLQRQIIHGTKTLGEDKLLSAEKFINNLNPDVNVELHHGAVSVDNITGLIEKYDFILDCTDRFESKFLINDACVLAKKPYSHAGVVRFEGQALTYVPGKGPCLRCLLVGVPPKGDCITCSQVGVVGAAVGVMGSIQALEAIKFILGKGELLTGKVLKFDGLNMKMGVVDFSEADKDCAVCGKNSDFSLEENRAEYQL